MKQTREQTVLRFSDYKIIKVIDRFGSWDYVLLKDNQFVDRSWDFDKLKVMALNTMGG